MRNTRGTARHADNADPQPFIAFGRPSRPDAWRPWIYALYNVPLAFAAWVARKSMSGGDRQS